MDIKYKRIVIKLSGEAIGKENGREIDSKKLEKVVNQLVDISNMGVEIAVVIGAGNFWRGHYGLEYMQRTTSDYMGMLATALNALALQDMIESKGIFTRVMSAIEMREIAEPYILRKALKHLRKKRIVIFACGTGNPYFTTDSAAALRAIELEADAIFLAKNIDGVYNKDPKTNSDAIKYDEVTYMQVISEKLKVMDATAVTLCMENKTPILVFDLNEYNSIEKALMGEKIGTKIER
ncbi:MAG: UMP kinase [Clostridia bacterium]|nr:UMP kinase [Clostridia bacterium]MDD4386512.1 UMP kinase [Clostridia bacterium]